MPHPAAPVHEKALRPERPRRFRHTGPTPWRTMGLIDFYSCAQVVRLLDDYVDRELSPHEVEQVERHLLECEHCARDARLAASTLRSIRSTLRRIQLPPGTEARVWRALAQEQRERILAPPTPPTQPTPREPSPPPEH